MGNVTYLRRAERKELRPINWMEAIERMNPTAHVCKSQGRIQSPQHPLVWIQLQYGSQPILHSPDGSQKALSGQELSQHMLDWFWGVEL